MERKDLLELKKRYKKEENTFTRVCGCYVNSDKKPILKFRESFYNLPDDEMFKYLEIAKKALSGKIGNNMLELTFPLDEKFENEKQQLLMMIKRSGLQEDALLDILYENIIESYEESGNYLIILYHDVYDVMTKTSDNRKLDESEEVYEYMICAICPVKLSKPGLGYFDKENQIKSRIRDWVVDVPAAGFTFPGFINRSSDVNTVMYYTKNVKEPQTDFMENGLGCYPKQTATNQLNTFEAIVKDTITDDEVSEKVFADIQENLNSLVEEHKEIYEDTDHEPIQLTKEKVKVILTESGVSEDISMVIESSYENTFGEEPPLAENLLDTKLIKKNEQKKKEERLLNQIEELESKLEEVESIIEEPTDENKDYDVVLQVKPEKLETIKTQVINGQRCILVPIDDDEQATINGHDDLL